MYEDEEEIEYVQEENNGLDVTGVQWFPGHMAKTRRLITENLKLVDIVLEMTDARVPQSGRNPELDSWVAGKPRILMLNKSDNADTKLTKDWLRYYRSIGVPCLACDCKTGTGTDKFIPLLKQVLKELIDKRTEKGMGGRGIRVMVVGIPNVGKSSFINRMAGGKKTRVEDRAGVTRSKQWVRLDKDIELLDMPGVLWPKFEDKLVGERLAFTGAVKDIVLDIEQLAARLLVYLAEIYPERLMERYKIDDPTGVKGYKILENVGRKRGMLISKGEINTERAAIMVVDEYRAGTLGKITFEVPPEIVATKVTKAESKAED